MNIKNIFIGLFLLLPLLGLSQEENSYEAKWDQGFRFTSNEGNFKLKFGGRIMNDWASFSQEDAIKDAVGTLTNGTEFRRIRFFNSGRIYSNINYKLQLDFAGGQVKAKDIFIEITKLPIVGNLKVGHFKEPFSLEELTSSKYITFMERSAATAFNPSRNTGVMIHNSLLNSRLSWQIGWFRETNDYGINKESAGNQNITGRIAGLPYLNENNYRFLHMGLGYSHKTGVNDLYSVSARPEAHMAGKYANTGDISNVDHVNLLNAELAFISGAFVIQGEMYRSSVNTNLSDSYTLTGSYGQISYLLTGENKNYKNPGSGFSRITPNNNFGGDDGGAGAWEVALRYSTIDLSDVDARKMGGWTAGVNWYLNPSVRIMANYGHNTLYEIGQTNILQMRFQLDF